jgi:hypothetical protein
MGLQAKTARSVELRLREIRRRQLQNLAQRQLWRLSRDQDCGEGCAKRKATSVRRIHQRECSPTALLGLPCTPGMTTGYVPGEDTG